MKKRRKVKQIIEMPVEAFEQYRNLRHGHEAAFLDLLLRRSHKRDDEFVVVSEAMSKTTCPFWGPKRIRRARDICLGVGRLVMLHHGGSRKGDPNIYCFPEGRRASYRRNRNAVIKKKQYSRSE